MNKLMLVLWVALGVIAVSIAGFMVWVFSASPADSSEPAADTESVATEDVTIYVLGNGNFDENDVCRDFFGNELFTPQDIVIMKTSLGHRSGSLKPVPVDGSAFCLFSARLTDVPSNDGTYNIQIPNGSVERVTIQRLRDDLPFKAWSGS